MFLSVTRHAASPWAPLAAVLLGVAVCGCAHSSRAFDPRPLSAGGLPVRAGLESGYLEDLEDVEGPPITPRTVSETMMLYRNARLEVDAGFYVPMGKFEIGPMAGARGEIEVTKDVFSGLSFDWAYQDVTSPGPSGPTDPEQFYEEIERHNFLVTLAYDWVLAKDFGKEDAPLALRLGIGGGATLIRGDTDKIGAPIGHKVLDHWAMLIRPSVDAHWRVWPHGRVLAGVGFDWVYPEKIDVRGGGGIYQVADLDFSTLFIRFGFSFEF